jgi:hypothetical protein
MIISKVVTPTRLELEMLQEEKINPELPKEML